MSTYTADLPCTSAIVSEIDARENKSKTDCSKQIINTFLQRLKEKPNSKIVVSSVDVKCIDRETDLFNSGWFGSESTISNPDKSTVFSIKRSSRDESGNCYPSVVFTLKK